MQNQLGFFFNAWRPRLAFLYAGVQGPLPVLRLFVTRCIFQCFRVQSKPKNLNNNMCCLETHVLSEVSIVATPAGKPGFFLHAWRPRLVFFFFYAGVQGPRGFECMQNQLGFFLNAWR